ncbi:indolepyruvate oxidoreductase subunit beta [Sinanaerobacter chloroacetimidivorans]|jgi:indolepyruvate ferredoxin oxidoreductase beta subunit|uniref:Indolepyruvate oxidoreductase subunit beta n=1 Tax=Sinanaerobacter chloroacetimidivorans TaxID=2818044 RepID=A0A8J7W0Q1_9FIRM|nr:indolepyruvate oxidoreductase subunit beta [Sinanaerobacter chloroacetimidivorans]MBR0597046.1 indolepyruvate oxidoreductase subunit beta [Sinanaerobacter chloroacetimidivorans]
MSKVKNILLVGVGGQGTILASKILSEGLAQAGYDVKMSEIHGMSQRGGNVSTQIRYGEKVYSPIVGKGEADVIVAFEKMEALRWIEFLKPDGRMVINDFEIPSVPIQLGSAKYPEGILEELSSKAKVSVFKAGDIAAALGNSKTMNIVLFGALVKAMNIEGIDWETVIKENVKKGFEDINIKAFRAGAEQVQA